MNSFDTFKFSYILVGFTSYSASFLKSTNHIWLPYLKFGSSLVPENSITLSIAHMVGGSLGKVCKNEHFFHDFSREKENKVPR